MHKIPEVITAYMDMLSSIIQVLAGLIGLVILAVIAQKMPGLLDDIGGVIGILR
jgi:hypothetical protein